MARILIFQHLAGEHAGSFRRLIAEGGDTASACMVGEGAPIPPLDGFDALMVLGGPMHVWQTDRHPFLMREKAAIAAWLASAKPYFGICLGHQLLAEVAGGTVARARPTEIGLCDVGLTAQGLSDPVLGAFPAGLRCLQWHAAAVTRLPPGAAVLATNAACAVQAIRVGRAWGVQWHPELDQDEIEEWLCIPEFAADLAAEHGSMAASRFAADLAGALPSVQADAATLWAGFKRAACLR